MIKSLPPRDKTDSGKGQLVVYESEDGRIKIDVRLENETVWLTPQLMAELFQTTSQSITIHLKNIFDEGELDEKAACKDFLQVKIEGKRQVERNYLPPINRVDSYIGCVLEEHVFGENEIITKPTVKEYLSVRKLQLSGDR